jgi:hypothetical protein
MRERATSLDAILPVLREKCVERAIARGLVKALARRARREDGSYEIDPAELARVYSFSASGETATASVPGQCAAPR